MSYETDLLNAKIEYYRQKTVESKAITDAQGAKKAMYNSIKEKNDVQKAALSARKDYYTTLKTLLENGYYKSYYEAKTAHLKNKTELEKIYLKNETTISTNFGKLHAIEVEEKEIQLALLKKEAARPEDPYDP